MIPELFSKVLNMSLTASFVIGVVIAARFALKKSPKIFSYALWAVVLFRLLCPVSLPSPLSAFGFLDAGTAPNEGIITSIEYVDANREVIEQPQIPAERPELPEMAEQVHTPSAETPRETLSLKAVLPWLWLAGAVGMLLFGIGTYVRFCTHLTGAVPMERNVYLVDHIDSAFVAGLLRPRIYLPSDLPKTERAYILEHEKYHLRRFDHVAKHLAFLALSIHWFNPLVWVAFILSGKDMEMSCDEAVIQKLGEGIRADYSVSLLNLATGRRILAGSPLAFGEGDTKGRVLNMARWRKPRKWISVVSLLLCLTVLTACAANPGQRLGRSSALTRTVSWTEDFGSMDGSVRFHIAVDQAQVSEQASVVEVTQRDITSADAQNVARALLGNVDFFEEEPSTHPQYSRQQYQQMLERISSFYDMEALAGLESVEPVEGTLYEGNTIKWTIDRIYEAMETAPEENPLTPCDWTLKKERIYHDSALEIGDRPVEADSDFLLATAEKDGLGYSFGAVAWNRDDYKGNSYSIQLGGASVSPGIDREIYWAKLCRTEMPTQTQITAAQEKVMQMLERMNLGQWQIAATRVQQSHTDFGTEYYICVDAVPVFHGVPALFVPAQFDQNPPTQATFLLSANGDLLDMSMHASADMQTAAVAEGAPSVDQLLEKAKNHLADTAAEQYGLSMPRLLMFADKHQEAFVCHVSITRMEYALKWVPESDKDGCDSYIPVLAFWGNVEYRGENSGTVYYRDGEDAPRILLTISAVDGTVIP